MFSPEALLGVVRVSRKVGSGGHRKKKQQFSPSFRLNEELVRVRELMYSTRSDLKRGGVGSDDFCPLGRDWLENPISFDFHH